MDMRCVQHEMVAQERKQLILDQRSSGSSVKKWCADQNVSESRYCYWLHVLRREEMALHKPGSTDGFAELRLEGGSAGLVDPKSSGICAVIRGQNMSLEIHNGADPRTMDLALRALGIGRGRSYLRLRKSMWLVATPTCASRSMGWHNWWNTTSN